MEEKASQTEGYYGGLVYTRMDWEKFREWFEEMIEMLPLEQEQLEKVTPDMTVRQIRDIGKEKQEEKNRE